MKDCVKRWENFQNADVETIMEKVEQEAASKAASTFASPELDIGIVIDESGSMNHSFDDMKSRWEAVIDNLVIFCLQMKRSEQLSQCVRITVMTFAADVEVICEHELVADLDMAALEKKLRARRPRGVTAMGKALLKMIEILDARKAKLKDLKLPYLMPMLSILSDGRPTNDTGVYSEQSMSQAYHEIDARLAADKITVLPVGIVGADADDAEFKVLSRLISKDIDGSVPLLKSAKDIKRYFRYIGQTAQAIEKGEDMRSFVQEYLGFRSERLA